MSYSAMICIRQAGEPPDKVANITESMKLIQPLGK